MDRFWSNIIDNLALEGSLLRNKWNGGDATWKFAKIFQLKNKET
jgi:hypothetical protein